ncbi:MAG: hypothetical protein JKX69_07435 [Rhodobacteraceae bacterium]|nr:hypothetical protein [Paracoccaceae bacterium]PHR56244.1 MAG: hypothetical protein COA47_13225 [Robiginitomaculum sp.]
MWLGFIGGVSGQAGDHPFTREQLRTGSVWAGGDQPRNPGGNTDGDNGGGAGGCGHGLVGLLCCIAKHGGLTGAFDDWLKSAGIDPDIFQRCLKELCVDDKGNEPTIARAGDILKPADTAIASLALDSAQITALRSRFEALLKGN